MKEKLGNFLVILMLLGAYSKYGVSLGYLRIPYVIIIIISPLILLYLNKLHKYYTYTSFFYFLVILVLSLVRYYSTAQLGLKNIKSLLLFAFSISVSVLFFAYLVSIDDKDLGNLLLIFTYSLLFLSVLDLIYYFHHINLQIGGFFGVISDTIYYRRVLGFRRPFPLGPEPSHLAVLLVVSISSWYAVDKTSSFSKCIVLSIISTVLVRSPIMLGLFISVVLIYLNKKEKSEGNFKNYVYLLSFVCAISIIYYYFFQQRISQNILEEGSSIYIRIIQPIELIRHAVRNWPVIGVGLGNYDDLVSGMGYLYGSPAARVGQGYLMPALAFPVAFTGILGLAGFLIYFAFNTYYITHKMSWVIPFVVCYLIIGFSIGSFIGAEIWLYYPMLLRCFLMNKKYTK